MRISHLIIGVLSFASFNIYSQDSLLKKSGEELDVKITEIADDYLKYKKKGLEDGPEFKISTSQVFMITFANGEKILFNKPIDTPKKAEEIFSVIRAGTEITLRMDETISSDKKGGRKVSTGEVITLTVNQDINDQNGNILVSAGTQVSGTVTNSVKRKAAGTKGKLSFQVNNVPAIDGQSIPVNLKYEYEGKSKTAIAVGAGALVAAPLLLIKGKPAVVESGILFNARVVSDRKIKLKTERNNLYLETNVESINLDDANTSEIDTDVSKSKVEQTSILDKIKNIKDLYEMNVLTKKEYDSITKILLKDLVNQKPD